MDFLSDIIWIFYGEVLPYHIIFALIDLSKDYKKNPLKIKRLGFPHPRGKMIDCGTSRRKWSGFDGLKKKDKNLFSKYFISKIIFFQIKF